MACSSVPTGRGSRERFAYVRICARLTRPGRSVRCGPPRVVQRAARDQRL